MVKWAMGLACVMVKWAMGLVCDGKMDHGVSM